MQLSACVTADFFPEQYSLFLFFSETHTLLYLQSIDLFPLFSYLFVSNIFTFSELFRSTLISIFSILVSKRMLWEVFDANLGLRNDDVDYTGRVGEDQGKIPSHFDLCKSFLFSRKRVLHLFFFFLSFARRDARPFSSTFLSTEGCMVDQTFFYTHNVSNKTARFAQPRFLRFVLRIRSMRRQNGETKQNGELRQTRGDHFANFSSTTRRN